MIDDPQFSDTVSGDGTISKPPATETKRVKAKVPMLVTLVGIV